MSLPKSVIPALVGGAAGLATGGLGTALLGAAGGSLFGGGGDGGGSASVPPLPAIAPAATTTGSTEAADEAARLTRAGEKRRAGRRASIFGIDEDDSLGATAKRPEAQAAKVLFGS